MKYEANSIKSILVYSFLFLHTLIYLTFKIQNVGAYFTYCINIEGGTGCKALPQRRVKSLEECKQWGGTYVVPSLHKETFS